MVLSTQTRHKVNCPKGKRGAPGDDSVAQLFGLVATDGTYELNLSTDFTVGCDDLGAPYLNRLLIAKT